MRLWRTRFRRALLLVAAAATLAAPAVARAAQPADRTFRECPQCPEMVAIPAGAFLMGSPAGERGQFDDEGPQHRVSVRAFALGKYDVTNVEFLTFLRETGYQPEPCDSISQMGWRSPGHGLAFPPGGLRPIRRTSRRCA